MVVPAIDVEVAHLPVDLATALFGLDPTAASTCQGTHPESLLPQVTGSPTSISAVGPEVWDPAPAAPSQQSFSAQGPGSRHTPLYPKAGPPTSVLLQILNL